MPLTPIVQQGYTPSLPKPVIRKTRLPRFGTIILEAKQERAQGAPAIEKYCNAAAIPWLGHPYGDWQSQCAYPVLPDIPFIRSRKRKQPIPSQSPLVFGLRLGSGEYLKESAGGSVLAYVTSGGIFQNGASAAVSRALGELGELGRLEPLKMVCFEFVLRRHRIEEQFVAGADIKAAANCTVEDFAH